MFSYFKMCWNKCRAYLSLWETSLCSLSTIRTSSRWQNISRHCRSHQDKSPTYAAPHHRCDIFQPTWASTRKRRNYRSQSCWEKRRCKGINHTCIWKTLLFLFCLIFFNQNTGTNLPLLTRLMNYAQLSQNLQISYFTCIKSVSFGSPLFWQFPCTLKTKP